MSKKISLLFITVLIAFGGFYLYTKYKVPPKIDLSKLSVSTLNGETFDLNSLKGKKTILSYGASWCPNCINEMNAMAKIWDTELKDVQIVIVDDEPLERVIQFKERKNYPFLFLKLNTSFPEIGINSIPVTYFFDANMVLRKEEVGEIDWDDASTREHYKQLMN